MQNSPIKNQAGISLIETLIILLIFTGMFITMQSVFQFSIQKLQTSKAKLIAVEIANSQIEILRNIDYNLLGTISGSPIGTIPAEKTIEQSNITFTVQTTIRYFDDPFDGCAGIAEGLEEDQWSKCADGTVVEKPRDIPNYSNNPADYKKVNVTVSWNEDYGGVPVTLSTTIAPKDLEGDTDKGFLSIEVIDASGNPVSGATVHINNPTLNPALSLTMTTDSFGQVLLFDLEPAQLSYEITVTKDGYTTDRTCSIDAGGTTCNDSEGVPDPYLRNASVHLGELEELTFIIDRFSTLSVNSYTESCQALNGIDFTLTGMDKRISVNPEIFKNVIPFTTNINNSPHWYTSQLEWDLYDLIVNTSGYYIAGVNHDLALNILPNTNTTINVLLAPQTPNALLVTAKDSGSGINLSEATVRVVSEDQTYDTSKITGHGFIEQTDWSEGPGQQHHTNQKKYFEDNNGVDTTSTSGQVTLKNLAVPLIYTEDFHTGTKKDGSNTNADWDVASQQLQIKKKAGSYPINEVQHAQTFKLNANEGQITEAILTANEETNGQTINYYLSADGGTTFDLIEKPLGEVHVFTMPGDDLRARIEMETSDQDITPIVHDFQVTYSLGFYDTYGELTSSTYDLGEAATISGKFTTISWTPSDQPEETGTDSIKFQVATNNDDSTWNFIGPDGTDSTYYIDGTADLHSSHDGDRYVRYKLFISTEDQSFTPTVADVKIGYTLACLPPGQAYFSDPDSGTHIIEVQLEGYEGTNEVVDINGYTTTEVLLTPIP